MKIDAVLILNVSYSYTGEDADAAKKELKAELDEIIDRAAENGLLSGYNNELEVETWSTQVIAEVSNEKTT